MKEKKHLLLMGINENDFLFFLFYCRMAYVFLYPGCHCEDVGVALQESERANDRQTFSVRQRECVDTEVRLNVCHKCF